MAKNRELKLTKLAIVMLLALCAFTGCQDEADAVDIGDDASAQSAQVVITYDQEAPLGKYDVDVYIDNEMIGTADYDNGGSFSIRLEEGHHELQLHKKNESEARGQASFVASSDGEVFTFIIRCGGSTITIKTPEEVQREQSPARAPRRDNSAAATAPEAQPEEEGGVDLQPLRVKIETLKLQYRRGYGEYGYTPDSNAAWETALEEAEGLINNPDVTEDDVAAMMGRLDSAIDSLVPCNNVYEMNGMECVFFGSYEQDEDDSNGAEPIEWIVLERRDGRCLLLSVYALEAMAYHDRVQADPASWQSCTLRAWLNESFLHEAFTEDERQGIESTAIVSNGGTDYEATTYDCVFILDESQATGYFGSDSLRYCYPTVHAVSGRHARYLTSKETGTVEWWLLQPDSDLYTPIVRAGGEIEVMRDNENAGIRPAIWVDASTLE